MENVTFYVYSRYKRAKDKPNPAKFNLPLDQVTIVELISIIYKNKDDYYNNPLLYLTTEGIAVPLVNSEENSEEFMNFVQYKAERKEPVFLIKPDSDCSVDRNVEEYSFGDLSRCKLDLSDFNKVFKSKIYPEDESPINKKLKKAGCKIRINVPPESPQLSEILESPETGTLFLQKIDSVTAMNLLKKQTNVLIPLENGTFLSASFANNAVNKLLGWRMRDDEFYECEELAMPVTIHKQEITCDRDDKNNFIALINEYNADIFIKNECTNITSFEREEKTKKERKDSEENFVTIQPQWFTHELEKFKAEVLTEVQHMLEDKVKTCKMDNWFSVTAKNKEVTETAEPIKVDKSTKIEDEDANLIELLDSLVSLENQLYSFTDSMKQNNAVSKRNKLDEGFPSAFISRRLHEWHSQMKKTAFHIIKKRDMGKVVELAADLYVMSKSGFKFRMSQNSSNTSKFILLKHGQYRNFGPKLMLHPHTIPEGVKCVVKPLTKYSEKTFLAERPQYSFFEIRVDSTEKLGKFRCYFQVHYNDKAYGNLLRLDIRVKPSLCFNFSADPMSTKLREKRKKRIKAQHRRSMKLFPDEGIGGNPENIGTASSDSDEPADIVNESKEENVNDEGIDAGCPTPIGEYVNSDEDTDSSVSLLLDMGEIREEMDDDLDIVKVSSREPNTEITPESVRKCFRGYNKTKSDFEKQGSNIPLVNDIPDSPNEPDYFHFAFNQDKPNSTESVNVENDEDLKTSSRMYKGQKRSWNESRTQTAHHEAYMKLCDQLKNHSMLQSSGTSTPKHVKSLAEEFYIKDKIPNTDQTKNHSQQHFSSIYPNLSEISTYFDPFLTETEKKSTNDNSSTSKESMPPVTILPEKVFEISSNVFKSVMNTMRPQQGQLSQQPQQTQQQSQQPQQTQQQAQQPQQTQQQPQQTQQQPQQAEQSQKSEQTQSVTTNVEKSISETLSSISHTVFNDETLSTLSRAVLNDDTLSALSRAVLNSLTSSTASSVISDSVNTKQTSTTIKTPIMTSQPIQTAEERAKNPTEITSTLSAESSQIENDVPAAASTSQQTQSEVLTNPKAKSFSSNQQNKSSSSLNAETSTVLPNDQVFIQNPYETQYNALPFHIREKLIKLNEMGFMNDSYNLFLINRYPKEEDFPQVIESLLNYNS